jgi:hypothetical protein
VDWLEVGRGPGPLSRLAGKLRPPRRVLRALTGLALATAVAVGAVVLVSDEEPAPASEVAERVPADSSLAQGSDDDVIGGWEIVEKESGAGDRIGFTTSFFAINRSGEARLPDNLEVVGRSWDTPGGEWLRASCTRAHSSTTSARQRDEPVRPGGRVLVACTFPRMNGGHVPGIEPGSVRILATPCEGTGRGSGAGAL